VFDITAVVIIFVIIIIIKQSLSSTSSFHSKLPVAVPTRQPFPNNSHPAIYVHQNTLGLFVTGSLN
jgi:hypothetical protein